MGYNRGECIVADVFVLHSRPYRDTSAIITSFSQEYGRIDFVAKGIRAKKNAKIALLQPFIPLSIEVYGNNELKNLAKLEAKGIAINLHDKHLYSALYINELLVRLLPAELAYPPLYEQYCYILAAFLEQREIEPILREFESLLLDEFGYGIELLYDAETGLAVEPEQAYFYDPELGVVLSDGSHGLAIPGHVLQGINDRNWNSATLKVAKYINRIALNVLLGGKPLKSRDLFSKRP